MGKPLNEKDIETTIQWMRGAEERNYKRWLAWEHSSPGNIPEFYISEIARLRRCLADEEKKPFWTPRRKHNIGFWHGCIVQTQALSRSLLPFEDYKKVIGEE